MWRRVSMAEISWLHRQNVTVLYTDVCRRHTLRSFLGKVTPPLIDRSRESIERG